MKKYLIGGVVFAIVMAVMRHLYFVHEENAKMDAFIDAKLANLQMPLDCPPLGRVQVTFDSEGVAPEMTRENIPIIVKQWDVLWPSIYGAIDKDSRDGKDRDLLAKTPAILVAVPDAEFSSNPDWWVQYTSEYGYYKVELTGMKVTSAALGN